MLPFYFNRSTLLHKAYSERLFLSSNNNSFHAPLPHPHPSLPHIKSPHPSSHPSPLKRATLPHHRLHNVCNQQNGIRFPPRFRPWRELRTPPNPPLGRLHPGPLQVPPPLERAPGSRRRHPRPLQLQAYRREGATVYIRLRVRRPVRVCERSVQNGGPVVCPAEAVQGQQDREVPDCEERARFDPVQK